MLKSDHRPDQASGPARAPCRNTAETAGWCGKSRLRQGLETREVLSGRFGSGREYH